MFKALLKVTPHPIFYDIDSPQVVSVYFLVNGSLITSFELLLVADLLFSGGHSTV